MNTSPGLNAGQMAIVICCGPGCCVGCQNCCGMGIGCHQTPCRCELPCTCRWKDEDTDPKWRDGCERHNSETDTRNWDDNEYIEVEDEDIQNLTPCPVCGSVTACSYDAEGLPLIHSLNGDTE